MNCNQIQQKLLLKAGGEMPPGDEAGLCKHLEACAECRAFSRKSEQILAMIDKGLPDAEPTAAIVNSVIDRARQDLERPGYVTFMPALKLLSYAAGIMILIAGGYVYLAPRPAIVADADATKSRISQASTIVAMMAEKETAVNGDTIHNPDNESIRVLARQLLQHEGLLIDDPQIDIETTQPDDARPRDLQSRSTYGVPQAGCV